MNGWRRGEISEEKAERVIGADFVVAIGDDEENLEIADTPAEESQHLERGAV
jgi:hypothetical protein